MKNPACRPGFALRAAKIVSFTTEARLADAENEVSAKLQYLECDKSAQRSIRGLLAAEYKTRQSLIKARRFGQ